MPSHLQEMNPQSTEPERPVVYVVLHMSIWDFGREDVVVYGVYETFADAKKVAEYHMERGFPDKVYPWKPAGNHPEFIQCDYTDHWVDQDTQMSRWVNYMTMILPKRLGGGEP